MKCKYCENNVQEWRYLDKLNICKNCRNKIRDELEYKINKNNFNDINIIEIIKDDKNQIKCYISIFKELYFYIYKCIYCNRFYIHYDHPSRTYYKLLEDSNINIFCSNNCQLEKTREDNISEGNCIQCGKPNKNRTVAKLGVQCGCAKKNTNKMLNKNLSPGIYTNPDCNQFSDERDAVGHCPKCSKNQLENLKTSGKCTICKIYNIERDQNGRGKDSNQIINFNIINCSNRILNKNFIPIVSKNAIQGCNCSKKWFLNHNNSENMIEHSKILGKTIGKFNLKSNIIEIKFCKKCNKNTPYKYNLENKEFYCQVCAGEKVWCERHQQFETVNYNSDQSHGLFYKSKTRNWIKKFAEEFNYIQSIIEDINNLKELKPICGIYLWRIDNIPYYCGKSYDILSRAYDHMYEIQNDPEYWLNIGNTEINSNHTISVEVLQECDRNISDDELHNVELKWIAKIKPMTQICTNDNKYDNIIPLNQRDFNLENLKDKYEERIKYY